MRQVGAGSVEMHTRTEMLDLIVHDGAARGIVVRDLITGDVRSHTAHAVVLATGGYGNVYYLSTNAMACNVTAVESSPTWGSICESLLHTNSSHVHTSK